jgi:hypothetical protein
VFSVRRVHIELYGRWMEEERHLARATIGLDASRSPRRRCPSRQVGVLRRGAGCWRSSRCGSGVERSLAGLGELSLPRGVEECHGDVAEVAAGDGGTHPTTCLDNQTPTAVLDDAGAIDTAAAADLVV